MTEARQPLCYVLDDEPAIGRFVALAVRAHGVAVETFVDLPSMMQALRQRAAPSLVFLDVSLGASDAIEAIRSLAAENFAGTIQLMSGSDAQLLEDVRLIGERHSLRMRPVLAKPFRVDAVRKVLDDEKLLAGGAPARMPAVADGREDCPAPPRVALRDAVRHGWVELWYQPKVDLDGMGMIGAEGLARVRHPDHGILLPGSFLPGATDDDMLALTEFALHTALTDSVDFADSGFPMSLAINVTVDALMRLPIATIVRAARGSDRVSGVTLEVTEDQVLRDIAAAHEIATQLRIQRIPLAIDDFGSGYSSLARLKELPFAELKLDRSFVTGCGEDREKAALCKMVAELAHRFGSVAVAEGVETPADLAAVRKAGCDVAQGFLFSRAVQKDALLTRLVAHGVDGGFGLPEAASRGSDWRAAG